MEHKSDKELAIEATIGYIRSWNAASNTKKFNVQDYYNILQL